MQTIVGIVAEYNPFHNGHAYHIEQTRARLGADRVGTGRFGAHMQVELLNDGPVSVELRADATG